MSNDNGPLNFDAKVPIKNLFEYSIPCIIDKSESIDEEDEGDNSDE
jgi:hypothetical protein